MTIFMVHSNPVSAARAEEFDTWYSQTHLPEVLALPGVVSARRFAYRSTSIEAGNLPEHQFLAIYEIDGDPDECLASLNAGIAEGRIHMSDVLDLSSMKMSVWAPLDS